MRYWHRKKSNSSEMHDGEGERDRDRGAHEPMASALRRRAENPVASRGHPRNDHGDRRHAAPLVILLRGAGASLQNPGVPCIFGARAHRCGSFLSFFRRSRRGRRSHRNRFRRRSRTLAVRSAGQQPVPPALGAYLKTWVEPAEPFRIVGPIYYVGTKGLAAYLITTPAGHILLDGGMPDSAEASRNRFTNLALIRATSSFC